MTPVDVLENVDVIIKDDLIYEVGRNIADDIVCDRVIDGTGKTLIPGNVCGHHHYYSGLSRGMLISAGPQTDFIQVLKEWWWRLDRGLDEESTYYSSIICSADAIMAGTTTNIDHHASPCYIENSLSTIAAGMEKIGVRGMTCYEVTDRNFGMDEVKAGVKENVRFIEEKKNSRLIRGMVGGHAPFTIPDEGLELMADACRKTGAGIHLHIAEDKYDVIHSHHHYGMDIVKRLENFNLLSDKTLLVHALHINDDEIDIINRHGCFLAHNPRSNMNNHVGYFNGLQKVDNLIIGTDGCGGNMFEEIKIGFFKHKDNGGSWWPADYLNALTKANRLLEKYYTGSKFGRVEKGYKADLVLLDYHSPTPIVRENAAGHFVWGMSSNSVESVMVDGDMILENHKFVDREVDGLYDEAMKVAADLWKKVDRIKP